MSENVSQKSTVPMLSEENKAALAAIIESGALNDYLKEDDGEAEPSLAELLERDEKEMLSKAMKTVSW